LLISAALDTLILNKPDKVGRNIAFSAFRVASWWRGAKSGAQILPPPADAPTLPGRNGDPPIYSRVPIAFKPLHEGMERPSLAGA